LEVSQSWLLFQAVTFNPVLIILMIGLLLLSAFFSMTETAYSSVGRLRMKTLGNNLANIALASVSVILFTGIFGQLNNADTVITLMNTGVMTILILIFGEILPKSIAKSNAEKICLGESKLIYLLIKIMTPITYPFLLLNRKVTSRIDSDNRISVTESDLETIIGTMEEEGSIDGEEADMLQKVLDLSEITVEEIMTPRVDMVAIEVNDDVKTITDTFFKNKYSRLPVYDTNTDNIIGVLSERDFYTKLIKDQNINIRRMVREPLFIPTSTKVDALIELLQTKNMHLAIVVDEYGGVDGIVTMEDALEELVGEIYDEHDDITETITKKDDYTYIVNADYDLEDLFEDLNLGEPPVSDSTSIGGWLFEMFQDIPEVGEEVEYEVRYNQEYDELSELINEEKAILVFKILSVTKRRIKSVMMTINVIESEE